jgi:hypothetical protein
MPTADQIRNFQALRGRFLAALWDADADGVEHPLTTALLANIDEVDLLPAQVDRVIRTLHDDALLHEYARDGGERFAGQVGLTAAGRAEVERWTTQPEDPTAHLPIPYQMVFNNTFNGPVHSSAIVQGSPDATVKVNATLTGHLARFVDQYRILLDELPADGREDAEADLDTLAEQVESSHPTPRRIRPLATRLVAWADSVAGDAMTSSASSGVQAEVERLGHELLRLLP